MKNNKIRILTECAVMLAAASALSFVKFHMWAYGGGITACSMLPLVIICRRHGTKVGLLTAFAHSVLQLFFGFGNVTYVSEETAFPVNVLMILGVILLDYIIAYTVIGLSSAYQNRKHESSLSISGGIAASFALRFLCHFLSGWIIWEALAPNELRWAAPVWSMVYNASYMIPEILLTCIAAFAINENTALMDRLGASTADMK